MDQVIRVLEVDLGVNASLAGESKRSEMRGSGYWSFFVILLSSRKSTQSQREPSFFFTNRTGAPWDDDVEWMNPLVRFLSMNSFNVSYLNLDNE